MKNKMMFKVDFKEARENAGLEIPVVEKIAQGIGHDIDLYGIECNKVKPTDSDVNLLLSIYNSASSGDSGMKF
ncbi:MAG: hypothetical protein MJ246_01575 [Clostridia bacterium]|nr:hypothetical protein [Clostridia bacterium]